MNSTYNTSAASSMEYIQTNAGLVIGLYGGTLLSVILTLGCCSRRDYGRDPSRGYKIVPRYSETNIDDNKCCAIDNSEEKLIEYFSGTVFESVYVSYRGLFWSYLLCATRVVSFIFFFSFPLLLVFVREKGRNWIYFTFWNIELIVLYFLLASTASIIGIWKKTSVCIELSDETFSSYSWTNAETFLGFAVQILYVVAAPSALFITLSYYLVLSAKVEFYGASFHLLNTIAFFIEFSLNSIIVRLEHLIFFASWLLLYVVFVWGMVLSGALSKWPYSEIQTATSNSLAWYSGLYTGAVACYLIWYLLSRLKFLVRGEYASSLISLSTQVYNRVRVDTE